MKTATTVIKQTAVKTITTIAFVLCTAILFTGCGEKNSLDNRKVIQYFEKDIYTRSINADNTTTEAKNTSNTTNNSNTTDNEHPGGYEETLGELKITGDDTSILYDIIDDTDISYNNVLYKNLYKHINSLDTKYDKNTLINFIIKVYKAESDTIYCALNVDEEGDNMIDGEVENLSVEDRVPECPQYDALIKKYDERVNWMLELINTDNGESTVMFGAHSYIMIVDNGMSREVDMTKYDPKF